MKAKLYFLLVFILIATFSNAQDSAFVYYQFEGNSSNYLLPSSNSQCSSCVLHVFPANCDTSTTTKQVNQYLNMHLTNGQLRLDHPLYGNSNVIVPTCSSITVNVLVNLDPIFDLQRKNVLFNLTDSGHVGKNLSIATGYIDYASIHFDTHNDSGDVNKYFVRLKNKGPQSWDYFLNPARSSNWHLITFVYDGSGLGEKRIYIDGLQPGIYAGSTLIKSDFTLTGDSSTILSNLDILYHLNQITFSSPNNYDQIKGYFDEFALYPYAKSSAQVYQDYLDVDTNLHYTNGTYGSTLPIVNVAGTIDTMEFPVNYNVLDTPTHYINVASPIAQFLSYPLPRFLPGHTLNRNVNFAKAMKMAGINSNNLKSSNDPDAVPMAVNIQNELAENWNYYYNFSEHISNFALVMTNGAIVHNTSNANVNAAYIYDILNSGKNYPLTGFMHRAQLNVSAHANSIFHSCANISTINDSGSVYQTNIANPQCLIRCPFLERNPDDSGSCFVDTFSLYPRNNSNQIIHPGGANRASWSPVGGNNRKVYQPDGHEMVRLFYEFINPLNNYHLDEVSVKRIKLLVENNEIVSAYNDLTLVKSNKIDSLRKAEGFITANFPGITDSTDLMRLYQSNAKANIDIDYRDSILFSPYTGIDLNLPADCKFINYFVDGRDDAPFAYQYMRKTNSAFRGNPSLATSIYPQGAAYWNEDNVGGDVTGWIYVTHGRNSELKKDLYGNIWNDKWFSPFISAGYSDDERDDMRPGQYLGFLKALNLLGVDFFIPGYYMQQLPPANWGRSYCWQMASPVYAQALNSRTFDFFENGYLLDGDVPWNLAIPNPNSKGYKTAYRFNTTNPDELVVARKMNDKALYLISGTLQATSGYTGAFGLSSDVHINLKDTGSGAAVDSISFNIRRQGSTYIYDNTDTHHPAFWQIDKWHQYEHPERWSKDFDFEAEVMDNKEAICTKNPLPGILIQTEGNLQHTIITNGDYRTFTSFVTFEIPSPLEYRFQPRRDGVDNNYTFYIMARNADTTNASISGLSLTLTDLTAGSTYGNWKINCINSADWGWYGIDECNGDVIQFNDLTDDHQYMLSIVPANNELEIDRIYLAAPNTTFSQTASSTCSTYDFNITDNSQPQSASTVFGGNSISHKNIYLAPDVILHIDDNFTFENCIFTMGGNNNIVVMGGYNLSLLNSDIHACGEMWNEISTEGGSNITCNGTTVEDAMTAFRLTGSDQADFSNSLFCKNWNDFNLTNSGMVHVDNSIFDYPKPYLPPPDPMIDLDPTHIAGSNSKLNIENSTFRNSSLFSIMLSYRNTITVNGCSFEENKQAFTYSDPISGADVTFRNSKIKSGYEDNGNMKGEYGISIWGSTSNDINFTISNNSITDYTRPILLMNLNNTANANNIVEENHLQLTRTVEQLGSDDYRGIKLVNCTGINLDSNSVAWTNNPKDGVGYSEQVQGIRLEDSKNAVVSENLIEKTGAAITIKEDCSGINFTCNTMSRCYTGVYLDSNGVANIITDQGALSGTPTSWNNKWENMQNANGYKVMGTVDPTIIAYWLYEVNQTSEYSPVPIEPSLATNIISQPCSTTTSLCDPPSQIMMMAMRDNVYGDAVGDSAYFVEIEPEFLYNRKQSFYKAAVDDTSLLNLGATNDQVYIEAYDSLHETNIGNLVATDTLVAKHDYSNATARLNSLVYPNTIEENHKYALQIYMDNYGMGIKPDSAILVEMDAKAHQHAFFGGTGIYLLRGMLHLDIEDQLPQLRRMQKGTIVIPPAIQQNFFGKLFPNPSSDQVNYICKINNGEKIELAVQNSMNETILHLQLVNELTTFNTKYLSPGIYYYLIN